MKILALELNQENLITDINIRFNTFMRFAIKHAVRNNEPRNLYNLAFHYSALLKGLNVYKGKITFKGVSDAFNLDYSSAADLLSS